MNVSWQPTKLAKILTPVSRAEAVAPTKEYRLLGVRLDGRGPFLRETVMGSQSAATRLFQVQAGDFIYSRLFAWRGAFGAIEPELDGCYVSGEFPTFQPVQNKLDTEFLRLWFRLPSIIEKVEADCTGSTPLTRNRFKENFFLDLEIPLPPLAEQRRIVARIESLAAKIGEASLLRGQTVEEAEGLVNARARQILAEIGEPVTELRCWLDSSRVGIQTGPFGAQLSSHEFQDSGVPVLTIGNVQYGGLDIARLKHVSGEKAQQLNRYTIQEGDILFARMGTVGRCCVVPIKADGWLINYHIIRVALNRLEVDSRFAHWTIRCSEDVERYLEETVRGATREGVNSGIVGSLPYRVPSLDKQRRIVAYLDSLQAKVDELKKLQSETAAELAALLPSILDKAFKAEL